LHNLHKYIKLIQSKQESVYCVCDGLTRPKIEFESNQCLFLGHPLEHLLEHFNASLVGLCVTGQGALALFQPAGHVAVLGQVEADSLSGGGGGGQGDVSQGHFTSGSPVLALEELVEIFKGFLQLLQLGIIVGSTAKHDWVLQKLILILAFLEFDPIWTSPIFFKKLSEINYLMKRIIKSKWETHVVVSESLVKSSLVEVQPGVDKGALLGILRVQGVALAVFVGQVADDSAAVSINPL
jgi:hypothetical protein